MDAANGQKPLDGQLSIGGGTGLDKNHDWQMELLMEKLRSKSSALKSLVETAKNLRMAMLDKRFAIDSVEKGQLQKCLDTLQHSIKVTSLQSMVERLESLTRQLGLKFMMPEPSGTELFISSDMFFLEVLLEPTGIVKDVKIHHEGKNEQQSCEELVSCLSRGDFVDFTAQLEGLASIYQLNADKKVKCKAFSALQSLEADLGVLAQLQTFMKEPFNLVHKSPVGILEKRKGGHAMKLTYFVSPYDLIDKNNRTCDQLTSEAITTRKIGHNVTVCMEGSTAHKLPISNIITVNRSSTGKNTPSYAPLTGSNSSMLPACFVLKLGKKMPMCLELVNRIQKVTELECIDVSKPHPLLSLIVQHSSNGQLDCRNNRGLFVTLPDQQHCYFMTENKCMEGVLVGSIPFTHPAHVPQILVYLRQQALFNTLLTSCVRSMARHEIEQTTMFEISALSWQHMSVSLEHPFEETMATIELDLTDISALKCKLYGVCMTNTEQTSEIVSKVLQRCLSIPVTMRALIKTWEGKNLLPITGIGIGNNSGGGTGGIGGGGGTNGSNYGGVNGHDTSSGMTDFTNGDNKNPQESGGLNGNGTNNSISRQTTGIVPTTTTTTNQQQQSFLDAGTENSIGFPSFSGQADTPSSSAGLLNPLQLGGFFGQDKNSPTSSSTMVTESATTPLPSPTAAATTNIERSKKNRKRKTADGAWRSPKNKNDDNNEILLESCSSSDSTPLGTPTSSRDANGTRTPTPTSTTPIGIITNLDLSNLDPNDLVSCDTRSSSTDYDIDNDTEIMEVHDLQDDYTDIIKRERKLRKNRANSSGGGDDKKSPNLFDDSKNNLIPPSVSITPISNSNITQQATNYNSVLTGMGLERRPGIEIIPISSTPQTTLPSSITITPITSTTIKSLTSDERRDRKQKSTNDDKLRLDKKRKRKREDSPMGPPEKLPPKQNQQDPLTKPVSVSIKPTDATTNRPSSPASTTLRKFNPSSTQSPLALVGKSSPTLKQSVTTTNTNTSSSSSSTLSSKSMQSPKHSPVYNSPKHTSSSSSSSSSSASVSPKHGTSSPKHGGSSSGKPSISTLKSAASNSPSSSSSSSSSSGKASSGGGGGNGASGDQIPSSSSKPKSSSSSKETSSRDKDRKNPASSSSSSATVGGATATTGTSFSSGSSSNQSPKTKSSSSKVKQLELLSTTGETIPSSLPSSGSSTPPSGSGTDLSKATTAQQLQQQQARNRKGSLSAVIDKLKNAQHVSDDPGNGGNSGKSSSGNTTPTSVEKDKTTTSSSSSSSSSAKASSGDGKSVGKSIPSLESKNSAEYMVKHSLDGMKITINKTRTKDGKTGTNVKSSGGGSADRSLSSSSSSSTSSSSSSSSSSSGNGSPKTHTGLKPGVNSGPASKKPQSTSSIKVSSQQGGLTTSSLSNKIGLSGQKISSIQKLPTNSNLTNTSGLITKNSSTKITSGSPKMSSSGATDLSRNRDKQRQPKSIDKSLFGTKSIESRKSSPSQLRDDIDSERAFKLLSHGTMTNVTNFSPQSVVEGLVNKLDTKFQIPKLSARVNADSSEKKLLSSEKITATTTSPTTTTTTTATIPSTILATTTTEVATTASTTTVTTPPSVVTTSSSSATVVTTCTEENLTSKLLENIPSTKIEQAESLTIQDINLSSSQKSIDIVDSSSMQSQMKPDNLSLTVTPILNLSNDLDTTINLESFSSPSPSPSSSSSSSAIVPASSSSLYSPSSSSIAPVVPTSESSIPIISSSPVAPSTSHDSDVPTNLSMQSDIESCKDLTITPISSSSPGNLKNISSIDNTSENINKDINSILSTHVNEDLINTSDLVTSTFPSSPSTSSSSIIPDTTTLTSESLNLSTKPADAALNKYKIIDDENINKTIIPGSTSVTSTIEMSDKLNITPVVMDTTSDIGDILLDFSTSKETKDRAICLQTPVRKNTPPPPALPPLPSAFSPNSSVSLHNIVKSPIHSPSSHSIASPCITDDELMDEALVGLGK